LIVAAKRPQEHERWLVLMRHSSAGQAETFFRQTGLHDSQRPLTEKGDRRNRRAVRGLIKLLPEIDRVWSSPYLRAQQTAAPLAEAAGCRVETPELLQPPWRLELIGPWLESELGLGQIGVLVGHEPDLSDLIGHWIGARHAPVGMEKGAACLLRIDGSLSHDMDHELIWKLPQYVLRSI
jgi:phosphohistidine phosphatase